jgi:hypothetical protein
MFIFLSLLCFSLILPSVFPFSSLFSSKIHCGQALNHILPHLKIYLSADSLPHEKNYLKRWTMTSSTPGATLGERGVEDGAKHGDKERVE